MLKISYTLNLGQLLKIVPKFKRYFWQKLKPKKTKNVSKASIEKQVNSSVPKVGTTIVITDNHMALIPSIDWEEYNRGCLAGWRFWS